MNINCDRLEQMISSVEKKCQHSIQIEDVSGFLKYDKQIHELGAIRTRCIDTEKRKRRKSYKTRTEKRGSRKSHK